MIDDKEFIRADEVANRFGWDGANYSFKKQQLTDALESGRVTAKADRAVLTRCPHPRLGRYVAKPESFDDWIVEREAWGGPGLNLAARRYEAKNIGDFLSVKLTGLWFSLPDIVSYLGWAAQSPEQASPRKGTGGSPVDSQKWTNFAALLGAYAQSGGDISPGEKAGALYSKVMDFGARLGLREEETPSIDTLRPALNRAMELVQAAEAGEGQV